MWLFSFISIFSIFFAFSANAELSRDTAHYQNTLQFLVQGAIDALPPEDHDSANFLNQYKPLLSSMQLTFDDTHENCSDEVPGKNLTYAYTATQEASPMIFICKRTPFLLNEMQLLYVLLHENAHRFQIKDESQANFVAGRIFNLVKIRNPFYILSEETADQFVQKIAHYLDLEKNDGLHRTIDQADVRRVYWNSAGFFDFRPYHSYTPATYARSEFSQTNTEGVSTRQAYTLH